MKERIRKAWYALIVALGAALVCVAPAGAGDPPPAPPENESPENGSDDIRANPSLCVTVSDPQGQLLEVEFFGRELTAPPAEGFTLIAMPDTQLYSASYPHLFAAQTQWVVDQREPRNIAFVTQLGDCVHHPTATFEWDNADAAMSFLEDPATTTLPSGIPYGVAVGNHDQNGSAGTIDDEGTTTTHYNQYFGIDRFQGRDYYGGHYGINNDNHFELFSASGMDFVVVHLEFDGVDGELRASAIAWADDILKAHADRRAILVSHYLLDANGTFGDQGQAIYDGLKDNPNLFLMLCGHLWGQPRRTDTHQGNTVHTLLANYQWETDGGNAKLRILRFVPGQDRIEVDTYSPWLDQYSDDPLEQFDLAYDMEGGLPFEAIGSVKDVVSGTETCVSWPGGSLDSEYEWFVKVSDATSTTTGPRWTFVGNGQCGFDPDCDDGNTCTQNSCVSQACFTLPIPGCCDTDADCDDDNACTDDICDDGECRSTDNLAPCTDGNSCTTCDTCLAGVCSGDAIDCDDANDCTVDQCADGICENLYMPGAGCCDEDQDCGDSDPCTEDRCDDLGRCENVLVPDCCSDDLQCQDSDPCTADTCSRSKGAMHFDGLGAHVYIGDAQELNSAEFTIECWFKWDGGGETTTTSLSDGDWGGIRAIPLVTKGRVELDEGAERHLAYFLGINDIAGNVLSADFEEHDDGPHPGLNHPVVGTTPVSVGVWHHAAATYDGCCWELYLDGQPDTDGTTCPARVPNFESGQHFALGTGLQSSRLADGAFSGLMDEARLWNRALTQKEIQANMNAPIESHPDLLGRWGLDEGFGYVTEDSTGNGHYGSIVLTDWETADLAPIGSGSCSFPTIPDCCASAADCDDDNACTFDNCVNDRCRNPYLPDVGCCVGDEDCDDDDACTADACNPRGSCSNAPLDSDGDETLDCIDPDDDGDGVDDCEDCAPNDPAVWSPPPEITGVVLDHTIATIVWWDPMGSGFYYHVASGLISQMRDQQGTFGGWCILNEGTYYGFLDARSDPEVGDGYYYLVRGERVCDGSYGASSSGEVRLPDDPCP